MYMYNLVSDSYTNKRICTLTTVIKQIRNDIINTLLHLLQYRLQYSKITDTNTKFVIPITDLIIGASLKYEKLLIVSFDSHMQTSNIEGKLLNHAHKNGTLFLLVIPLPVSA